jgi:metallo-beta-lactamase family protein
VYVDSPLSIQVFKEYQNVLEGEELKEFNELMNWSHLKFVKEAELSQALCDSVEPAVIIASSGFMTQGRVRHHAKRIITNPLNSIIFMGYSSEGSLASQIKNNKIRKVEIDQKEYVVRCSVYSLKSFSGHIMCDQLLDYIGNMVADRVIIHHANKESKENFARLLKARYEENLKTTKVSCSNSSMRISM